VSKKILLVLAFAFALNFSVPSEAKRLVGNLTLSGILYPESHAKVTGSYIEGATTFIIGTFDGDLAESPSRALSRLFLTDPAFTDFGTAFQLIAQMPSMLLGLNNIVLHLQGYNKDKIIIDFPVGSLLWRGDLALTLAGPTMRYLWNSFVVSYGGILTTTELMIIPTVAGLLTGLELSVKGNTFGGAGVELITLFGNSTDLTLLGAGGGPPVPTTSLLQWTSTELILSGLSFFEWVYFENTSKFSKKNGFEFTRFDFHIEPEELELIKFDLSLTVSLLATKMLLTTKFDLDIAFLYIYSTPLDIHGLIIPFIDLGSNQLLSAIVALKDKIYKRKATSHIDLKARDYYLNITVPDPALLYEKTDFEAALSLEGSSKGLNYSGNLYFVLDNLKPVFMTGKFSYEPDLAREFALTAGIAIDPIAGLRQLVLKIEWWFYGF
jgi:hypothetical protein